MTMAQKTNSLLLTGVLILSLVVHGLFVTFFSLGRSVAAYDFSANEFMTVQSITIPDTAVYGDDPPMTVNRTILRSFQGNWIVRVATARGEWVCGNEGSAPYTTDAELPEDMRLFDFWLFMDKSQPGQFCRDGFYPLPPGCYIVDTTWEVLDDRVQPPRLISKRSNEFCVTTEDL